MCGIVGLYLKNPDLEGQLGSMVSDMLIQMTERGPDSAGFAIYHDPVADGFVKVTLQGDDDTDWSAVENQLQDGLDKSASLKQISTHAVCTIQGDGDDIGHWIEANMDNVKITSVGSSIEIFKEKGLPTQVINKFDLSSMTGTHALGHTRMATESAVTTEHSHPFNTGLDLCLVHNGSLSNHNRLREKLRSEGIRFQTDNDSEVAAG